MALALVEEELKQLANVQKYLSKKLPQSREEN
jgi:hypothetical protein